MCDDGSSFTPADIASGDPNKFALEFVRRMKGVGYLRDHICEPTTTKSTKVAMEAELIAQLKGTFYGTTFFDECSMKKVLCVQIANAALCLK